MSKVYICAAKRTAIGSMLGTLKNVHPADFAAVVVKQILSDANLDAASLNDVVKSTLKELRDLFNEGKYESFGYDKDTGVYKYFKLSSDSVPYLTIKLESEKVKTVTYYSGGNTYTSTFGANGGYVAG